MHQEELLEIVQADHQMHNEEMLTQHGGLNGRRQHIYGKRCNGKIFLNMDTCRDSWKSMSSILTRCTRLSNHRILAVSCRNTEDNMIVVGCRGCNDSKMPMDSMKAEDSMKTVDSRTAKKRILFEINKDEAPDHSMHGKELQEVEGNVPKWSQERNSARRITEMSSQIHLNLCNGNFYTIGEGVLCSNLNDVHEGTVIGTTGCAYKEKEEGDTCWSVDSDGALFSLEQDDELEGCFGYTARMPNSYADISWSLDMFVLGEEPKKAWNQGEGETWWKQHGFIPDVIRLDEEGDHKVMFERKGGAYLFCIMQNFIFDPGGSMTQAHLELGWRSSLLTMDSLPKSMFLLCFSSMCNKICKYESRGRLLNL